MPTPKDWRQLNLLVLFLVSSSFFLLLSSPNVTQAAEESQYFPETKKTLRGKFLEYWRANGGLPIYGYPITEAQPEVDPETGKTFLTQWFERNRFELHPENAGTKYEVLLGLLGKDLKREALGIDQFFVRSIPLADPASPSGETIYFAETGHNVRGLFYKYWLEHGGLEQFGYPISEPYVDSLADYKLVQWFERARFEYQPGHSPAYVVQLGLLGNFIKKINVNITSSADWVIGRQPYSVINPNGVAVDNNSNIYVTDSSRGRILKYDRNLKLVTSLAEFNDSHRSLTKKIKVDPANNIYILKESNSIYKYSPGGQLLATYNRLGKFYFSDFAVDASGAIYGVKGDGPGEVNKFDANGQLLAAWTKAANNEILRSPVSIVLDSKNNVYVADIENKAIYKYDSAGNYLANLEFGANKQEFRAAYQLAMNKHDNLYLTSRSDGFLFKFDTNAGLVSKTKLDYHFDDFAIDTDENIYTCSISFHLLRKQTPQNEIITWGVAATDLVYPPLNDAADKRRDGLATDKNGNIYFADPYRPAIKKFDKRGQLLATWGKLGDNPGEFSFKRGASIGIDAEGFIYVADDKYIQKFDSNGGFVVIWGQQAPETAKVDGLAIDPNGYIYTAKENKITKFDLSGKKLASWNTRDYPLSQNLLKIAVDKQGNVFALHSNVVSSDEVVVAVQKYDSSGRYLLGFKAETDYPKSLNLNPAGIALDGQGNVYVAKDKDNSSWPATVTKFSNNGEYLARVIGSSLNSERLTAITTSEEGHVYVFDESMGLLKVRLS